MLKRNFVKIFEVFTLSVYDRIKNRAHHQGFKNLQTVAKKAGIATNLIYSWKNKEPKMNSLVAVANTLRTTTDYLNGLTDNPELPDSTESGLTWSDFGMPYGGKIPDELKGMYKAIAEQYVKDHPESINNEDDK